MSEANGLEAQLAWLRGLAERRPFPAGDRRGTLNYLDEAAVDRAAAVAGRLRSTSLARELTEEQAPGSFELRPLPHSELEGTPIGVGLDVVQMHCHGGAQTHIDGLNHFACDGTWYGGFAVGDLGGPSIADWGSGIVARAVYVDVARARGTAWVAEERPVAGDDLDSALGAAGIDFEPGDALLIDMGRDEWEAAGHRTALRMREVGPEFLQPGLSKSAADWINDHRVSVLCSDFQDALHPEESRYSLHLLLWAIGLAYVNNCSFRELKADLRSRAGSDATAAIAGALVVSPLRIPGGSGSDVNPVILH